jgi:two-component sensor histidine kinase
MWQRRKNGEEYPARVTTTVVRNKTGQLTHYVGNVIDVTHSQQQEQQRLLNETAHRNTLVNEVHHRIKNNLHGITGLLRQFAQKHPETADPINQAIGQVQGISVIHGLQGRADRSSVRLCELTAAIANEIQNLWRTPITLELPPAWQPCVIAEKEAVPIALVLNELVLNAVKHGGKAHGQVSITLQKGHRSDRVQIRVTNAGQLSPEGRPTGAPHSGLQLIEALMPRHGARIVREQHGGRVITLLELETPVISVELKTTT